MVIMSLSTDSQEATSRATTEIPLTISVAMCTFNGSRYLEEQLASIAQQTALPLELVICDDGSTDATGKIVQQFALRSPFPVRFHQNANTLGSTANFEQAIRLCRGDLIALCDQDDRWVPEKLAHMGGLLQEHPEAGGVFSDALLIDGEGSLLPQTLWQHNGFNDARQKAFAGTQASLQLIQRDTVTGAAMMFRASFVPMLVPIAQGWVHDGWIAALIASFGQLRLTPACLIYYRLHTAQQVGLLKVPWHAHLSTQKERALAFHAHQAQRYSSLLERIEQVCLEKGDPAVVDVCIPAELKRKSELLSREDQGAPLLSSLQGEICVSPA